MGLCMMIPGPGLVRVFMAGMVVMVVRKVMVGMVGMVVMEDMVAVLAVMVVTVVMVVMVVMAVMVVTVVIRAAHTLPVMVRDTVLDMVHTLILIRPIVRKLIRLFLICLVAGNLVGIVVVGTGRVGSRCMKIIGGGCMGGCGRTGMGEGTGGRSGMLRVGGVLGERRYVDGRAVRLDGVWW